MAPTPDSASVGSTDMTNKYKEIVKSNGIHDPVAEVIIESSGLEGVNFGSTTKLVTVKFENPNVKPLNLFVKALVDSESHTQYVVELKSFEKEAVFYTKYIPAAREYCKKLGREDLMSIYPKCYYGDKSLIVFENLVIEKGFILLKSEERQNFDAAKWSVTNYAKHHALSHAVIQDVGGSERFFKQFEYLDFEAFHKESFQGIIGGAVEGAISRNIEILESTEIDGKEKALSLLKGISGTSMSKFLEALKISEEDKWMPALNHGDAHSNNMMFQKDKETGKITGQVLVDFQVTRFANPCVELQYFIFSSVQPVVRREQLQDLLKIYLDTLNKTCESLGHPLNLSFEKLFETFRRKAIIGFSMGIMMSNELSHEAMKTIDVTTLDMKDLGIVIEQYIRKVLKEKPEIGKRISRDIIDFMEVYSKLSLD